VAASGYGNGRTAPTTYLNCLNVTPVSRDAIEAHAGWVIGVLEKALVNRRVNNATEECKHFNDLRNFCHAFVERIYQSPAK
jgi:hypothetical protein